MYSIFRADAAALILLCAVSMGCSNASVKPYPVDWPRPSSSGVSLCAGLNGRYVDKAERQTGYRSVKNPDVTDAYLSGILAYASIGRPPQSHGLGDLVRIKVLADGRLSFQVKDAVESIDAAPSWICRDNSVLQGTFGSVVNGESLPTGRRSIKIEMTEVGRSNMALHKTIEDCGAYFSLVPACEQTDDWYLFQRVQ
jgi:hypothetical protein